MLVILRADNPELLSLLLAGWEVVDNQYHGTVLYVTIGFGLKDIWREKC